MNAEEIYRPLGVSPQVCAFGERVLCTFYRCPVRTGSALLK